MNDSLKTKMLVGMIVIEIALLIPVLYNVMSYVDSSVDASHHESSRVKQQKETFVSNEFESSSVDTVTDHRYEIEVDDQNVTVTAVAKYDDGTELTEADKRLVAEILRQIGQKHVKSSKTFYAGGYGEVEDVNHLGGSCGYYKTRCCGKAYVCPKSERSVRSGDNGTVYGRGGFSNTVNPSMKMGGTASSLSAYPGISF